MLENATYGAKAQSARKDNPKGLLQQIIEDNPNAGKPKLLAMIRGELMKDGNVEFLDAVIEYWFTNMYASLTTEVDCGGKTPDPVPAPPARRADPQERERAKVEQRARVEAIKQKAIIVFMDMMLPTGKSLRESTGKECAKAGGMYAKIAERVKPNQKVGQALSEADLAAIWKSA